MKRISLILLFLSCVPMFAQIAVPAFTVPAPDGTTIVSKQNVWSCVPQPLPAGMSFDGTTLNVPKISTGTLTLADGPVYQNGQYLITISGATPTSPGVVMLTAAPASTPAAGATYTVTLPTTNGTSWTPVPGLTVASGQTYSVNPVFTGAPNATATAWWLYANLSLFVNSAGTAYVRLQNTTSIPITGASALVTVK